MLAICLCGSLSPHENFKTHMSNFKEKKVVLGSALQLSGTTSGAKP